jgi:hypothetical protein
MDDVRLYLVRIWTAPNFRASAQLAGGEVPQVFARPEDLLQFLAGTATASAARSIDSTLPTGSPS